MIFYGKTVSRHSKVGINRMHTLFLDAPFTGKVELSPAILTYLATKKCKNVGLYASVQFCNNLARVYEQLTLAGVGVITSKTDRTHVSGQLLGCDSDLASLNLSTAQHEKIDAYLYVGDGKFHPLALVYAQKDLDTREVKEIICHDPMTNQMQIMDPALLKVILRKYKASLMKFLCSTKIGVLVTVKPGQEHLKAALTIEKKFPEKKFYFFVDDNISFEQLENFPFIETWINTACPRVGFDDQEKFERGVINLNDAFLCKQILSRESMLTKI